MEGPERGLKGRVEANELVIGEPESWMPGGMKFRKGALSEPGGWERVGEGAEVPLWPW